MKTSKFILRALSLSYVTMFSISCGLFAAKVNTKITKSKIDGSITAFAIGQTKETYKKSVTNERKGPIRKYKNGIGEGLKDFPKFKLWAEIDHQELKEVDFGLGNKADDYFLVSYIKLDPYCLITLTDEEHVNLYTDGYNRTYETKYAFTKDKQFLIDFRSGSVFDFNLSQLFPGRNFCGFTVYKDAIYYTLSSYYDWGNNSEYVEGYLAKMSVVDGELKIENIYNKDLVRLCFNDKDGNLYFSDSIWKEEHHPGYYSTKENKFIEENVIFWEDAYLTPDFELIGKQETEKLIKVTQDGEEVNILDYPYIETKTQRGMYDFGMLRVPEINTGAILYEDEECIYFDYSLLRNKHYVDEQDHIIIEKYYRNWTHRPELTRIEYDAIGGKFKDKIVYLKDNILYSYNFIDKETSTVSDLSNIDLLEFRVTFGMDDRIFIKGISSTLEFVNICIDNGVVSYEYEEEDFYVTTLYPIN